MKRLFLTTAIAATAMIIMACSGNSVSVDGNPSETTQELPGQTLADESPSQNAEMVISAKGIDGVLMLDMALDKLLPLIDGLYDKVQLAHEEDEGDIVTVADFTLNGTTVITGVSNDGKTIGKLDFTSDRVVLRSGDRAWRLGDKPNGMKFNDDYQWYEHDGVIANIDTDGRICSFLVGY